MNGHLEPPDIIPDPPLTLVRPKLAYLAGGSTWNLSSEEFLLFLADTPKAILMRCPAKQLSYDGEFHYYLDIRSDRERTFVKAPEDNFFTKRAVWSRAVNDAQWQLHTAEATLATPW